MEKLGNMETRVRSLSKGVIYRLISIITLAIITYIFTGNLVTVTLVTAFSNIVFLIVFYIHERIWLRIERPKKKVARSIAKMFTYITVCGITIMSLITYTFTGSIQIMTGITVTYVSLKHVLYIFHELLWDRISWGHSAVSQI